MSTNIFIIIIYYIIGVVPYYFMMLKGQTEESVTLMYNSTLRLTDVLLVALFGISVLKYFVQKKEHKKKLQVPLIIFLLYVLFSVFRNISSYGINALGEFRYTYIILFLPLWIIINFKYAEILTAVKLFVIINLVIPIMLYPILSVYTGSGFNFFGLNGENRIFSSDISLSLLLCTVSIYILRKYSVLRINNGLYILLVTSALLIIFLDSHRSVWLTGLVVLLVLIIKKEIRLPIFHTSLLIIPFVIVIAILAVNYSPRLSSFLSVRSMAFFSPEADETANWRLNAWEFQIYRFINNPVMGEGLGGYWGQTQQRWDVGIMPHNMYIIILAKLGLIGMTAFLYFLLSTLKRFNHALKESEYTDEYSICLIGYIVIFAILSYSIAYAFDNRTTFMFLGLSLALINYLGNEPVHNNTSS